MVIKVATLHKSTDTKMPWSRRSEWKKRPNKRPNSGVLGLNLALGLLCLRYNICWVKSLYAKFKTTGQNKTTGQRAGRVNTDQMPDLPVSPPPPQQLPPAKYLSAGYRQPSPSAPIAQRVSSGSISEATMLQEWTKSSLCAGQTFLEYHPGLSPLPSEENYDVSTHWGKVAGLPILAICEQKPTAGSVHVPSPSSPRPPAG